MRIEDKMNSVASLNRSLIIIAFDESPYQKGFIHIGQKYYEDIKKVFPEIIQLQPGDIAQAIGVWGPSMLDQYQALQLNVKEIYHNPNSLQIKIETTGQISLTSREVKSRARNLIKKSTSWDGNGFLPMVCVLTSEQFNQILDNPASKLKDLFTTNNWTGIYELYQPIKNLPQRPEIWNNAEILSSIGFACEKLSEVGALPDEILRDENKKNEYLEQLKQYRKECIFLFNRCVELEPENPRYYSNLGYHHYQNVLQLKIPRGRRDGDVSKEISLALSYLDKALSFSSDRLNDLYRKGYLLASILPDQLQYGGSSKNINLSSDEARKQGIACLEQLIRNWETMPENDARKKRFRKEYIKSLYNLGQAYYELVRNPWDEITIVLKLKTAQPVSEEYLRRDIEYAQKAWHYFYKCWLVDRSDQSPQLDENNLHTTPSSGEEEGVNRLYWLGKVAFLQHWILSHYGMKDTQKSLPYAEKAVKFLQAALDLPWSPKSSNQRKDFIVELLGRVYLALEQPQKTVQLFEGSFKNKPVRDAYIQNTYAMGLILTGNYEKAARMLDEAKQNRFNLDRWTTTLLQGCNALYSKNFDLAKEIFENILQSENNAGKLVSAYAWVGLAFVAYHDQDIQQAIQNLEKALYFNPYHLGIRHKMIEWKKQST